MPPPRRTILASNDAVFKHLLQEQSGDGQNESPPQIQRGLRSQTFKSEEEKQVCPNSPNSSSDSSLSLVDELNIGINDDSNKSNFREFDWHFRNENCVFEDEDSCEEVEEELWSTRAQRTYRQRPPGQRETTPQTKNVGKNCRKEKVSKNNSASSLLSILSQSSGDGQSNKNLNSKGSLRRNRTFTFPCVSAILTKTYFGTGFSQFQEDEALVQYREQEEQFRRVGLWVV
eukprot:TRINITY_DN1765_c1_g1_i12.p2 TRINITY_DN1765_c1_g1~~TRINITY_DN1765_c1_g1_i12.p2  ORF type:complete len:230 (-),score=32.64 TRINITY_DN1765_c1_g1_i12:187-876(-)